MSRLSFKLNNNNKKYYSYFDENELHLKKIL